MTDAHDDPETLRRLRQDAWDWVFRMTSGEATKADLAALEGWCAQSPRHAKEYALVSGRWRSVGPAVEEMARQRAALESSRGQHFSPGRRALLGGAAAAAAAGAAVMIVRPPFGLWPSFNELAADYRTATGEQRQILLAGAASVEMNTQTSLNVRPSTEEGDRIELIAGEAIVATRSREVEVIAGSGRASAARAQFNIRRDGPNVCVTCIDGLVRVTQQGHSVDLQPAQQLVYASQGLGQTITVDPTVVTGWRQGDLYFENQPLLRVIEEINRYRPGKIVLMNDALGQRRYTVSFKLDRLNVVVAQLQAMFGARVTSLPGGIIVLS
jgi:transmembrane sensor